MRTTPDPRRRRTGARAGFTLIEVLVTGALMGLLALVTLSASGMLAARTEELVLRQKAILALNAEMEQLVTYYTYSSFGAATPRASTGYGTADGLPDARFVYPSPLPTGIGVNPIFLKTSISTWDDDAPYVLVTSAASTTGATRNYVWVDLARGVAAQLSWIQTDIVAFPCFQNARPGNVRCRCHGWTGSGQSQCRQLTLVLEYPYRVRNNQLRPDAQLERLTARTIVGRR